MEWFVTTKFEAEQIVTTIRTYVDRHLKIYNAAVKDPTRAAEIPGLRHIYNAAVFNYEEACAIVDNSRVFLWPYEKTRLLTLMTHAMYGTL